jgi:hypothetical protein
MEETDIPETWERGAGFELTFNLALIFGENITKGKHCKFCGLQIFALR